MIVLSPSVRVLLLALAAALLAAAPTGAQSADSGQSDLELSLTADGWFPGLVDRDGGIETVLGADVQASFLHIGPFSLLARAGFHALQTGAATSLAYVGAAVGGTYTVDLGERFDLTASASAGLGRIPDVKVAGQEGESYGLYEVDARVAARYRLSAGMRVGAFAGYERLATPGASFLDAPSVGIGLWIVPGEMLRSRGRVEVEEVDVEPIFPVLRSWYDDEPLGSVTIRNREDGPIDQVEVYFQVPDYMGGQRLTMSTPRIGAGEAVEVPLYAVFDERVLTLTENSSSVAEVTVEYSYYGAELTARETFPIRIYHRNTMTWVDDRRAAAFVSPTDPAALWFARSAGSVARDRLRVDLPRNMQVALSIFEALRLYGLNYVIDPNSSYIELSQNASAIDFLQYPGETLTYRGGDCDDLSILYASLLESAGISTAFITIPAHIYLAFDLGLSEEEALERFFDPGLLIIRDGRAWAPIEITMVREGFVKAWRVGAKQWIDNSAVGRADFFPMRENWGIYPPSALPDANARFELPEESELMAAFDESIDRFVVREMSPVIAEYEGRLADERDPATLNEYGVELANAGMLDEAWERFAEAADAGYAWAWNNLANVAFIRKDYDLAREYYEWADGLLPGDPVATLGLARASYELDRYQESEVLYADLSQGAPLLADRFGYLASVYGGEGRAWSMADRLASTVWSRPGLDFSRPRRVADAPVAPEEEAPGGQASPEAAAPAEPAAPAARPAPAESPEPTPEPAPVDDPRTGPPAVEPEPEATTREHAPSDEASTEPEAPAEAEAPREPEAEPPATRPEPAPPVEREPEPELAEPAEPAPALEPEPEPAPPPRRAVVERPEPAPEPAAPAQPSVVERLESTPSTSPAAESRRPEPQAPPAIAERAPLEPEVVSATPPEPEPEPAPRPAAPSAPPAIRRTAPRDAEIATAERREQERAEPVEPEPQRAPEPAPAPEPAAAPEPNAPEPPAAADPQPVAPPAIASAPPEDAEIAERRAARHEPESAPEPTPRPSPEPEPTPEPEETVVPEPEPVVVPTPPVQAAPEPAPEPAPTPEPAPVTEVAREPAPEPEPEPDERISYVERPEREPEPTATGEAERPTPTAAQPVGSPRRRRFATAGLELVEGPLGAAVGSRAGEALWETIEPEGLVSFLDPGVRGATGAWELGERLAQMTDRASAYAKLLVPAAPISGATRYGVRARSTGTGRVGFGIHIHGRGEWSHEYYGGGDSILVWVTSDREAYGDGRTRLQVYRSTGEWQMEMITSVVIPGSVLSEREYAVDYDPTAGTIEVYVDGSLQLSTDGFENPATFDYTILRALDTAEFSDLSIRPANAQDARGTR